MKILIVDDSTAMRMIVRRQLRQAGLGDATVVEAVNGADALAKVAAERPDLVLSDWNMPEMSGYELLVALRQQGDEVRFGFVTSEQTPAMRHQAFEAGASFLIAKPFTADAFAAAIGEVAA